ncbi:MAG: hypothetical protein A2452_03715 [Candidatus Firestonebacteria bacterium RIFOXYC2_FULL_39_67]|nr:MAG: hypothetical protein A2536_08450 [Candidatus Firestonebacteria bacterium RIFOXYD2_FULL_39_29]OGF54678.1 MAG: hypothetical protein A2452_03715 [Candidatus Firestonebacteria bacterium RIFOXYC2_FULL_39_67]
MIIRCTVKLMKEMGIEPKMAAVDAGGSTTLGDWHANLFYLDRKKNVIFMNDKTVYTVIAFQVNREQIRDLGKILRRELGKTLLQDGVDGALIQKLVEEIKNVSFGPTNNRRVVGAMVDHTKYMWNYIDNPDTGWSEENLSNTIKLMNRTPMLAPAYVYAVDLLGVLLGIKISTKKD